VDLIKTQQRNKARQGVESGPVFEAFDAIALLNEIADIQELLLAEEKRSTLAEEIDRDPLPADYPFHCFSVEV